MSTDRHTTLRTVFDRYRARLPQLTGLEKKLSASSLEAAVDLYDSVYPLLERQLWAGTGFDDELLGLYQSLFREQEALRQELGQDKRYAFAISIPIADRPDHLRACLESIYQLCRLYGYGGKERGLFSKVTVVIAEDSKSLHCVEKDVALAAEYTAKGLRVIHFGQQEQFELLSQLPEGHRQRVSSIVGTIDASSADDFYHKGQAVMRNLSYLKLIQLGPHSETLYYFVDSDQTFQQDLPSAGGDRRVSAINYFYNINRIFCETNTQMLTGKLVGDPPVSPSVMAGNFLDDVNAFMQQLAGHDAHGDCKFHAESRVIAGDAAYHDMAKLFGFDSPIDSYPYYCQLGPAHDHIACLNAFANRLDWFFFGEHPTRKTYFSYEAPFSEITPARTIYPGNYITTFEGLKYIIPFGQLRLRMSGPTAGRLIQAEIGERFASVNMPMLHSRVLQQEFIDEFRPGVEKNDQLIDLNDEFERQFFGDLMLFSVVELSRQGGSAGQYTQQRIEQALDRVEAEMLELYRRKHETIKQRCDALSTVLNDPRHWWGRVEGSARAVQQIRQFIRNIQHNFGDQSAAYGQIQSKQHRRTRKDRMAEALLAYHRDRAAWDELLELKPITPARAC